MTPRSARSMTFAFQALELRKRPRWRRGWGTAGLEEKSKEEAVRRGGQKEEGDRVGGLGVVSSTISTVVDSGRCEYIGI